MNAPWKARPTTYKGIQMRSRLEARWAAFMDAEGVKWAYEPMCFASERGQYLPDFVIYGPTGTHVYIEVKPTIEAALAARTPMEIIWDSEPDAHLWVVIAEEVIEKAGPDHVWEPLL